MTSFKRSYLLVAVLLLAACNRSKQPAITFIAGAATDFWTIAEAGVQQAARELPGTKVNFKYTTDGALEEQKRILDDALVDGVKGVVIAPLDPQNQKLMIDAAAATIPIVITDSDIETSKRLLYVGTSNIEAGKLAGQQIRKALPGGGQIILFVGKTDAQNAKERIEGIRETLQGSGIEIIDIKTDNIDRVRAKANVSDALVRNPNVGCLVGLWSYNGPAILQAVKEAGKQGQTKIVCFDEEEETLLGVKEGWISGTVVQDPFQFGYQSVILLNAYLAGDNTKLPAGGKLIIPAQLIEQHNVDALIEKMKKVHAKK